MNREVIGFYRNTETGEESIIVHDNRTGYVDNERTQSAKKKVEEPAWKLINAYLARGRNALTV